MPSDHPNLLGVTSEHPLRLTPDGGNNEQIGISKFRERAGAHREPAAYGECATLTAETRDVEALRAGSTERLRRAGENLEWERDGRREHIFVS